jgi:ArsR family transcriptional regulator
MSIEEKQTKFLKCIGDPTRLRILKFLATGEKCVCEIVEAIDKEQSLVSHHLKALKECNIVLSTQKAKRIYYRLANPEVASLILKSETLVMELPLCPTKESRNE